jgi:hypothetical protein
MNETGNEFPHGFGILLREGARFSAKARVVTIELP